MRCPPFSNRLHNSKSSFHLKTNIRCLQFFWRHGGVVSSRHQNKQADFDTLFAAALLPELCLQYPFPSTITDQFCIFLSKKMAISGVVFFHFLDPKTPPNPSKAVLHLNSVPQATQTGERRILGHSKSLCFIGRGSLVQERE